MAVSRIWLMCAAVATLAGCTTMPAQAPDAAPPAGAYAGKSVLDAAIDAAGGLPALSRVKELYWTGHATQTVDGKVSEMEIRAVVRPFDYARVTTWAKADGPKKAHTVQVEQGKAWDVTRVVWNPMPEAQAKNENQMMGLYSFMLLAPLKSPDAVVKEQPVGADGTRAIQATLHGQATEMAFDLNGKLVRAGGTLADPKGGPDIAQVATFSGEIANSGVTWPRKISIARNGQPYLDIEITTFEASPEKKVRIMEQSMQYDPALVQPGAADAG